MVPRQPCICFPFNEGFFRLKSGFVVCQNLEDVVFPKLFAVSKVQVIETILIVIIQCCEISFFCGHEVIRAVACSFVKVCEDDDRMLAGTKVDEESLLAGVGRDLPVELGQCFIHIRLVRC